MRFHVASMVLSAYPPGECRLVMLNPAGDLNAARKNGIKDGSGISGGDHHRS